MTAAAPNVPPAPLVVGFITLGCPKNLIDSERMLANLALEGFVVTGEVEAADVAVVNTCAFIDEARQESGQAIAELVEQKRRGRLELVIVAGCYPQLDREAILEEWPDVDAVVGLAAREDIGKIIRRLARRRSDRPLEAVPPFTHQVADDRARLRLTPRHYAYLRITEGCNNRCSYCTIPRIRGLLRSKPLPRILSEATELVADGAKELIVIGQDTTAYGQDLKGRVGICDVLARLAEMRGLRWLRLLYTHPASFPERLIKSYGELEKLLPYVDLPLQHISQPILDSMGRRTTRAGVEQLIDGLRRARPGMALRTSLIVGYPGETDGQFAELLDFVRQARFDRLGAFAYSAESGTRAAALPGHVPPEVKQERLRALMMLQQEISAARHAELVGRRAEAIIDQGSDSPEAPALGRLWSQAPDIDGATAVHGGAPLQAGEIIEVEISAAGPYDLEATVPTR